MHHVVWSAYVKINDNAFGMLFHSPPQFSTDWNWVAVRFSHAWNGLRDWAYELRMLLQNFMFGTNWTNGKLFKNAMQKCSGGWGSSFFCAGNSFKEGNVLKRQHCMLIWENLGTKLFWHLRLRNVLSRDVVTEFTAFWFGKNRSTGKLISIFWDTFCRTSSLSCFLQLKILSITLYCIFMNINLCHNQKASLLHCTYIHMP
jgi:hypothetical protein